MKARNGKGGRRSRKGMSLIEVMFALTLLALLTVSNTWTTMRFAERQKAVALGAYRTAALASVVEKYMVMPYDSLAVRTGCKTVAKSDSTPFGYTSCVTVTTVSIQNTQVQIILAPVALTRRDTVVFNRSKNANASPLG